MKRTIRAFTKGKASQKSNRKSKPEIMSTDADQL